MKKSICSGSNFVGTPNQLSWCIKDIDDWNNLLVSLGYTNTCFKEEQHKKSIFVKELTSLIVNSVSGDKLAVIVSGHGTRVYNTAEEDFYDEALYFVDGVLVDDDLRKILDLLPDGVELFLFFDTCHSGGMMRLFDDGNKIKYVEPEFVIPGAKRRNPIVRELPGREIFISGCKANEYSYDASALKNGAATHYAIKTFNKDNTYILWINNINTYLPSSTYPQTPILSALDENKEHLSLGGTSDTTPVDEESQNEANEPTGLFKRVWLAIVNFFKEFLYTLSNGTKHRAISNWRTSLFGLIPLGYSIYMVVENHLQKGVGCTYAIEDITKTFLLAYMLIMAKDSLLEGLTFGLFKLKK